MVVLEFLERANINGLLDNFIITLDSIRMKNENGYVAIIIKSDEQVFNKEFSLINVTKLLKIIINNQLIDFEEAENSLIFKSKHSKFIKYKSSIDIYDHEVNRKLTTTKEELESLYLKTNCVSIEINDNFLNKLRSAMSTTLSEEIKFYSKEGKLYLEVISDNMDIFETYICDTDININNIYNIEVLTKIINSIDFDSKFILGIKNETCDPLPLLIKGKTKSKLNIHYFILPVNN